MFLQQTPSVTPEVRKRLATKAQSNVSNKRARKGKSASTIQTKDLGRWKPSDDLTLIIGVQQTCDLVTVHRGVKFSCKFTIGEIQERWYALLYDPTVSRVAQHAMKNLHAEQVTMAVLHTIYGCILVCKVIVKNFFLQFVHPQVCSTGNFLGYELC